MFIDLIGLCLINYFIPPFNAPSTELSLSVETKLQMVTDIRKGRKFCPLLEKSIESVFEAVQSKDMAEVYKGCMGIFGKKLFFKIGYGIGSGSESLFLLYIAAFLTNSYIKNCTIENYGSMVHKAQKRSLPLAFPSFNPELCFNDLLSNFLPPFYQPKVVIDERSDTE